MYLSSLQVGLQSAHVTAEMFIKYTDNPTPLQTLSYWATLHKTIIILNGGYSSTLLDLFSLFAKYSQENNTFPWAEFHESNEALGGALTCIGCILPEKIYVGSALIRHDKDAEEMLKRINTLLVPTPEHQYVDEYTYTDIEIELMNKINQFKLAS
jgi:hypothetical protein